MRKGARTLADAADLLMTPGRRELPLAILVSEREDSGRSNRVEADRCVSEGRLISAASAVKIRARHEFPPRPSSFS